MLAPYCIAANLSPLLDGPIFGKRLSAAYRIDSKLTAEHEKLNWLNTVLRSFLHHLMTGKVRVPLNAAIV